MAFVPARIRSSPTRHLALAPRAAQLAEVSSAALHCLLSLLAQVSAKQGIGLRSRVRLKVAWRKKKAGGKATLIQFSFQIIIVGILLVAHEEG